MFEHKLQIGCTGRFRAAVHTGHTFDAEGNLVKEGEVLRETPFGRNKLTVKFFDDMLNLVTVGQSNLVGCFVAGLGNTLPSETDTVLTAYAGKCTQHVGITTTYSDTPDANGMVYVRSVFRATFNPGAFGASGSVNIAEGGITASTQYSTTSATPLYAHGLLVDSAGNPTTVSVNNATEYLDLFWEYTKYFKVEDTGTVSITIDGVETDHDWIMRLCNWRKMSSDANYWWPDDGFTSNSITLYPPIRPGTNNDNPTGAGTGLCSGPIGAFTAYPTKVDGIFQTGLTIAAQPKMVSKQRTWKFIWITTGGNVSGGAGVLQIGGNYCGAWQIQYTPKLDKTENKQLDLYVTAYMGNMP